MSLLTELKQQSVTATPLLLFECTTRSGDQYYWSSRPFRFENTDYERRILRHDAFELKQSSEDGLDQTAKVTLTLANADSFVSQVERTTGWRGAKLKVRFVFGDLSSRSAASEATVVFDGTAGACDEITEAEARITFHNKAALQRVLVPEVRIQKLCPWRFPETESARAEALAGGVLGRYSSFYRCGYSADQQNGYGSLEDGVPFDHCDRTREHCEQRGMFRVDSRGNTTARFGGVEFVPSTIRVRSFGEKGSHLSSVLNNESRYEDCVPLVYGTGWIEPPIVFARNDGNLTRIEVLVGLGPIEDVVKVIVNDVEIPEAVPNADMSGTGWFSLISRGERTGAFNPNFTDSSGEPLGDPYGSMAYLSVVVPNRVSDGKSSPRISALVKGLRLPEFSVQGASTGEHFSSNPAWILLDVIKRSGYETTAIDLASFAKAADYCAELIPSVDLHGNAVSIPRFQCNLILKEPRAAADLIRGIRTTAGLLLRKTRQGQIEVELESTLARQQAELPFGSNSTNQLEGGWPAYEFCDGSAGFSGIARRPDGSSSLRLWSRSAGEVVNRYAVEFQDEFNEYQQDSLAVCDGDDLDISGQELSAQLSAIGLPNFDQALRVARLQLSKSIEGNRFIEFETSVRGVSLRPGDLITVTTRKEGLERQTFRIAKISPGLNYQTMKIVAQWHEDSWYTDEGLRSPRRRREAGIKGRLPRPLVGSSVDPDGGTALDCEETVQETADGSAEVRLKIRFSPPRKTGLTSAGIPILNLSPTVATTGGSLAANSTFYYALSGVSSDGRESELSFAVKARTGPSGTNKVILENISLSKDTTAFRVYRGASPSQLLLLAELPRAGQFTDDGSTSLQAEGPPDPNYDHANIYWRYEFQPPVAVESATGTTVGNSELQMTPDENRGALVRITSGKGLGQERLILANTATEIVVSPPWNIVPDGSSQFAVCESTWKFGGLGFQDSVTITIPNRPGMTVHVSGRAANVKDEECSFELSPLRRWRVLGSGSGWDTDVPPIPYFGLASVGRGSVELGGLAFQDLDNTSTVSSGTLTIWYLDETGPSSGLTLSEGIGAEHLALVLAGGENPAAGSVLRIGNELLTVLESGSAGSCVVERGGFGTNAAVHDAGAAVTMLQRRVAVVPFARDFFGSPASGSYRFSVPLANARVDGAELFLTNSKGNSPASRINFVSLGEGGLRTLSGGQFSIQVQGALGIENDAAPGLLVERTVSVRDVVATVGRAPSGGSVGLRLRQGNDIFCEFTIPADAGSSAPISGASLPTLVGGNVLALDITSVPQGVGTLSAADLTVTIRL